MKIIPHLIIRELRPIEFGDAAALIGRGMSDNPFHVRVFAIHDKESRIKAVARFFRPVMQSLYERGLVWGAFRGGTLIGVCGMARPGFCQPTAFDKLRLVPAVLLKSPRGTVLRVIRWTDEWERRDPTEPHWHLGPVAVDPLFQHQGIGSRMMSVFCACTDQLNAAAYLETDKSENVRFYLKFDFTVVAQADVLGIPNWFMLRYPESQRRERNTPNF